MITIKKTKEHSEFSDYVEKETSVYYFFFIPFFKLVKETTIIGE